MKSTWVECSTESPEERTFRRPLGQTERGFYWDSVFRGTATTINHFEVRCEIGDVFSKENVTRTWLHLKQMFPLLGCHIEEHPEPDDEELLEFVVEERLLNTIRLDEINFLQVNSPCEADRQCHSILNAPEYLDASEAVSRLWLLQRTDDPWHTHIFFQLAHVVHDGFAITTIVKAFCNTIVAPNASREDLMPMEDRLRLVVASEDLDPALDFSPARRRWRRVVAKVIYSIQQKRLHVRLACFFSM